MLLALFILIGLSTSSQAQTLAPAPGDTKADLAAKAGKTSEPIQNPKIVQIAEERYWKLLLHYRDSFPAPDKSEADGESFFFSPKGRTDAYAELMATLDAFRSPLDIVIGNRTDHPQCFFPERFRYLRESIGDQPEWRGIFIHKCPEYEAWKKQLKAKSVTLVYAAPYLGSPASLFGHTFLRIDSQDNPMLDRGISFEAFTGTDGGVGYAIRGLTGSYPGLFSLVPYYLKTHVYTDAENRDLWEYRLNLTPQQIERMLGHAWEMGTTYFDYYFIDQNCAYHLLSLLEVANPEWKLRDQFKVMTIPADTLRVMTEIPGAVKNIQYRPSLLKVLNARLAQLSTADFKRFYELRENLSQLSGSESPELLDALLDWRKYVSASGSDKLNDPDHAVDSRLLKLRAKAKPATELAFTLPTAESEHLSPPHTGHSTSKAMASLGLEKHNSFYGLELRPVLHDILDPDAGYLENTELAIARAQIEYQTGPHHIFRIEDFTLASVKTLTPLSKLKPGFSWDISAGVLRPKDIDCVGCVAGQVRGGVGLSAPLNRSVLAYFLTHAQAQGSPSFGNATIRVGPSLEVGSLLSLTPTTKLMACGEYFYFIKENKFSTFHADFSQTYKQIDLRLHTEQDFMVNAVRHRAWMSLGLYF